MKPCKGLAPHGASNRADHLVSLLTPIARSRLCHNIPLWRNTSLSLAPAGRPCLNCRPLIAGSFRWPSGGQLPSKASHWSGGSRDRGSDWSRDRFAGSWLDGSEEWRTLIGWERQMLLWERRRRRGSTCQDHFMRTCFKFGQCGFVKAFYALNEEYNDKHIDKIHSLSLKCLRNAPPKRPLKTI